MKRLIIIAIIIVAAFMIFDKKEPKVANEPEEVTRTEELMDEDSESLETEVKKPVPAPPTPQDLIEEVYEGREAKKEETSVMEKEVVAEKKVVVTPKKDRTDVPEYFFDTKVRTYLYEWNIDFSQNDVSPGNIAFEVTNNGQFTHYFSIKDVADFGKVVPGETRVFTVRLEEGEFEFYSPRDIDMNNRMSETFRVEK
ncbi:hypothetical protein K9M41_02725 [Candidatus Gracilibacteria bacterium]|nr:hypothetical protein [Candidatus Gracilibacteria bacterium]